MCHMRILRAGLSAAKFITRDHRARSRVPTFVARVDEEMLRPHRGTQPMVG